MRNGNKMHGHVASVMTQDVEAAVHRLVSQRHRGNLYGALVCISSVQMADAVPGAA